jgi:hypothetical protein
MLRQTVVCHIDLGDRLTCDIGGLNFALEAVLEGVCLDLLMQFSGCRGATDLRRADAKPSQICSLQDETAWHRSSLELRVRQRCIMSQFDASRGNFPCLV